MTRGRLLIVAAAVAVLAALALGNPHASVWPVKCPLYQLTGWQCPMCGSQRAIHEAMHGHFGEAWLLNPALWIAMPWLVLLVAGSVSRRVATSQLYRLLTSGRAVIVAAILLLVWGVVRNV